MTVAQDNLYDRVDTAILRSPYLNKRELRFEADRGRVVLRGQVASYFHKQMAQEALRNVAGVETIENELEVVW